MASPRSRKEAIRMGVQIYTLPIPPKVVPLADIDRSIAAYTVQLAETREEVKLIRNGYLPPKGGAMRYVNPQCERGCDDCSFECAIFLTSPNRIEETLQRLARDRERAATRELCTGNVAALADWPKAAGNS